MVKTFEKGVRYSIKHFYKYLEDGQKLMLWQGDKQRLGYVTSGSSSISYPLNNSTHFTLWPSEDKQPEQAHDFISHILNDFGVVIDNTNDVAKAIYSAFLEIETMQI